MRRILLLTLLVLPGIRICYSQNNESLGASHNAQSGGVSLYNTGAHTGDGSGSLNVTFDRENVCGLNFVQVSQLVETRSKNAGFNTNGTGLPTTVSLAGLCGANDSIIKAYLYWSTSYYGSIANPALVDIKNPLSNNYSYNVSIIGLSGQKCWGETGTAAYRGDVTSCISGSGSYTINITGAGDSAYEVDGITLLVIYRDPTATYSGSLIIYDGIQTSHPGTPYLQTFTGFNVCAASSNSSAFSILADMQANENGGTNTEKYNGTSVVFPNSFWNFADIPTLFSAGQNSCVFNTYTNDGGFDCYSWIAAGLYWQNTTCVSCTPANSFVSISTPGSTICSGDSVLLTGNGGSGYSWAPAGTLSCTSCDSTYAKPSVSTLYTVSATTLCGTGTDTLTIHVIPSPTLTVLPANPGYCLGDSIQLTASGATSYSWSPSTDLSCSNCPNPIASPTATASYTLTGTNGTCSTTQIITVSVGSKPSLSVVPNTATVCSGNPVGITASGATTYSWNPSAGLSCNNCPTPTATPTATTIYTVIASNGGCNDTGTVTINVNPSPALSYSPPSPAVCPGDSIQVTVSGASTYKWLNGSGLTCFNCPNPTAFPATTTVYTVVGYGANGCTDTLQITVSVNATLTVTVNPSSPVVCLGGSTNLIAGGAGKFAWSPSSGLSCTNCFNPVATPTSTTTYTVIGSSGAGCVDSAFVTVTVVPPPVITVTGSDTVCKGTSATLNVSGAGSYTWSNGATTTSITVPSVSNDTTFTVTGFNGACIDSLLKTIHVYPFLSVAMPPADTICIGSKTAIIVYVKGAPPFNYVWNNGITSDSAGPFIVAPGGPITYICKVTDGCGDTASGSTAITPVAKTTTAAFFASPDTVILGGNIITFENQSIGGTSFFWNLGDGNTTTIYSPIEQYNTPGYYPVYLVSSNGSGCPDTAWGKIHVIEGVISVPNVFTPDGNGTNDYFHISAGGMQAFNIIIYNRWGQKVFESDSPNIDWNGRSTSGQMESAGTYYYIITAKDYSEKSYNLNGFVQLIR